MKSQKNDSWEVVNRRRTKRTSRYLIQERKVHPATTKWIEANDDNQEEAIDEYVTYQGLQDVRIPSTPPRHPLLNITLLILILLLHVTYGTEWTQTPTFIGPLFDCSTITNKNVHLLPSTGQCKTDFHTSARKEFKAEIRKYEVQISNVDLYLCTARTVDKICTENFLTYKEKVRKEKQIHVSNSECQEAIRTKITKYGKLFRHHQNHWTAHTSKNFKCYWWTTHHEIYTEFNLGRIRASLEGSNPIIKQDITHTHCSAKNPIAGP